MVTEFAYIFRSFCGRSSLILYICWKMFQLAVKGEILFEVLTSDNGLTGIENAFESKTPIEKVGRTRAKKQKQKHNSINHSSI